MYLSFSIGILLPDGGLHSILDLSWGLKPGWDYFLQHIFGSFINGGQLLAKNKMIYSNSVTDVTYQLTGAAWAEMTINTKKGDTEMIVSYSYDPLPDLLHALIRFMKNETRFEHIYVDGEGSAYELLLTELPGGTLRVEVFEDAYFEVFEPDTDAMPPIPALTVYTHTIIFSSMLVKSITAMIKDIGVNGYNEKWGNGHIFPQAAFDELKKLCRC